MTAATEEKNWAADKAEYALLFVGFLLLWVFEIISFVLTKVITLGDESILYEDWDKR